MWESDLGFSFILSDHRCYIYHYLLQVSKAEILRLIYQGRFLHGNVTLAALGLPAGKTTVMHLVPRESLPEPSSQDDLHRKKTGRSRCCGALTCTIL